MSTKQPKATATFNQDGTQVTITVEGQEGKTFETKLGALNHGNDLLQSGTVDKKSLWDLREQVLEAKNLKASSKKDRDEALKGVSQSMLGGVSVTVIEIDMSSPFGSGGEEKGTESSDEETPSVMENPVFRVCENCGKHGNFEDEAGTVTSPKILSKQSGLDWIKVAQKRGVIKPEDVQRLTDQVKAAEKIPTKRDRFLEMMMHAISGEA